MHESGIAATDDAERGSSTYGRIRVEMIRVRLTAVCDGDISGHGLRDGIGGACGLNVGVTDEQRPGDRRIGAAGNIRHHLYVPRRRYIARFERREVEQVRTRLAARLQKAIEHEFTWERVKEQAKTKSRALNA